MTKGHRISHTHTTIISLTHAFMDGSGYLDHATDVHWPFGSSENFLEPLVRNGPTTNGAWAADPPFISSPLPSFRGARSALLPLAVSLPAFPEDGSMIVE